MNIIKISALALSVIAMASCAEESTEAEPKENVTIINEAPESEKPAVEVEAEDEGSSISIERDEDGNVTGGVDIDL